MEKSRLKNSTRNNLENYGLNREMEVMLNKNSKKQTTITNSQYLNDRDMFNKFSNGNEIIDYTEIKHDESNFGMPIFNGQILNNKKSLISSPFMIENNNKDSFVSLNSSMDSNDVYESIDFDSNDINPFDSGDKKSVKFQSQSSEFNDDILNSMAYNAIPNQITRVNKEEKTINKDTMCKVEKDILDFEFDINKNKSREFVVDVNSPFALGYLWKSLILLTKNPTTDKLLKLLNVTNKDSLVTDMKYNADVFADSGSLELILPTGNQTLNSNFISKISNIYHIKIRTIEETEENTNIALLNMNWIFKLDLPFYYQPTVISGYLQGYKTNKIKFIQMKKVPVSLTINREENYAIVELLCGSNMILGFVYTISRQQVPILPYKKMLEYKKPELLVETLVIPKINRKKKSPYGKRFKEELSNIHFGELVYGTMYGIDINVNMGLEIDITKEVSKEKYEIKSNIDIININHKCYYYIKNRNIENKILTNGLINYG
jgi:hypothetical protein